MAVFDWMQLALPNNLDSLTAFVCVQIHAFFSIHHFRHLKEDWLIQSEPAVFKHFDLLYWETSINLFEVASALDNSKINLA